MRKCREEMRERFKKRKVNSDWEKGRKRFFKDRGIEEEKVGGKREEEEN